MRRFFAVWMGVAVGLSLLTGCVQTPKAAYLDRIWCGIIYRSSDSARLSPVCLRLSNDTLNIYSNALFGRSLETMSCRRTSDSTYVAFLPNAGVEFPMEFRYTAPDSLTRETLCIDGTDYWMELWPTTDSVFTAERLSFYRGREVPRDPALYVDGIWQGTLFRSRDGAMLSPVCLQFTPDTLFAYANAVFGRDNHALVYQGYWGDRFHYTSDFGDMALWLRWDDGELNLVGETIMMRVAPHTGTPSEAMAFYGDYEVPTDADAYLLGVYEGTTHGRIPKARALSLLLGGSPDMFEIEMTMRLTFLEGCRVRIETFGELISPEMQLLMMLGGEKDGTVRSSSVERYRFDGRYVRITADRYELLSSGDLWYVGGQEKGVEADPFTLTMVPNSNLFYPQE